MKRLTLAESAMRGHSLVTYFLLAIVAVGVGSYLWLRRSEGPEFILQATGIVLALSLAAEEIVRLEEIASLPGCPAHPCPIVEKKGNVGA